MTHWSGEGLRVKLGRMGQFGRSERKSGNVDVVENLQTIDNPFGTSMSPCLRNELLRCLRSVPYWIGSGGPCWSTSTSSCAGLDRSGCPLPPIPHLPDIRYGVRLFSRTLAAQLHRRLTGWGPCNEPAAREGASLAQAQQSGLSASIPARPSGGRAIADIGRTPKSP